MRHSTYALAAMVLAAMVLKSAGPGEAAPVKAPPAMKAEHAPQTRPSQDVPVWREDLRAECAVPIGWDQAPVMKLSLGYHQRWLSPSGRTVYGVVAFHHPLGFNLTADASLVRRCMAAVQESTGNGRLIAQEKDTASNGMRLVADVGAYKVHALLVTDHSHGWIIYAGTEIGKPSIPAELALAQASLDRTRPQ